MPCFQAARQAALVVLAGEALGGHPAKGCPAIAAKGIEVLIAAGNHDRALRNDDAGTAEMVAQGGTTADCRQ